MRLIRHHKIDWNKFLATMVFADPYGMVAMTPEALAAISAPDEQPRPRRKRGGRGAGIAITSGNPVAAVA